MVRKKYYFPKREFIFHMHSPVGPPTLVYPQDRAGIVQAGFYKYYRYYPLEDAGRETESRLGLCQDHTSTLLHDNTLNLFPQGPCVRAQSPGSRPHIFYTS